VRKLPAVFAVLSLSAVALVGCASSSDPAASCPRTTDAGSNVMDQISVTGAEGAAPTVNVHTPFHTTTTQFADVAEGTGSVPISASDQMVSLDVSLISATTGKPLVSTSYSGDQSTFALSRWTQSFPAFGTALHCATAGTRVAVAIAPGGIEQASAQSLGLAPTDSAVAVIDVRKVYLAAANGSPVYNSGWGMPAVVRAPGGRPGVIVPDGAAPSELKVQVLKRGDGAKVAADDTVLLNYTIVNWTDKSVADSTWDGEPQFVTLSTKSKGFQAAVEGKTVGSQVLAVIPKADGSSDAKDTQVVVIDILGIGTAANAQ
jgi:peptidylprolyl isomerase